MTRLDFSLQPYTSSPSAVHQRPRQRSWDSQTHTHFSLYWKKRDSEPPLVWKAELKPLCLWFFTNSGQTASVLWCVVSWEEDMATGEKTQCRCSLATRCLLGSRQGQCLLRLTPGSWQQAHCCWLLTTAERQCIKC